MADALEQTPPIPEETADAAAAAAEPPAPEEDEQHVVKTQTSTKYSRVPHDYFEPGVLEVVVSNYEGNMYQNTTLPHGHGTANFRYGHTYTGTWVGGRMHGRGTYTWVDGVEYKGDFVQGKAQGKGTYRWPTGGIYEGDVRDGLRHGKGTMYFEDNDARYVGEWVNGKRHGYGVITFDGPNGKERYEGAWENDQKCGEGTMHYRSGSVYTGCWKADQKCGYGVMTWMTELGVETYEGEWEHGKPNGVGEQTWELIGESEQHQMKNRYEGSFRNGFRHGFGIFHYATGSRYEGNWEMGVKHGAGTFTYEDGTKYTGRFADNHAVEETETSHEIMDIEDIVAEERNPHEQLRRTSAVLMRYMSDLRVVYRHYSFLPCVWIPGGGRSNDRTVEGIRRGKTFAISGKQFRRMLHDCEMLNPSLTLARANRIAAHIERTCTSAPLWKLHPVRPEHVPNTGSFAELPAAELSWEILDKEVSRVYSRPVTRQSVAQDDVAEGAAGGSEGSEDVVGSSESPSDSSSSLSDENELMTAGSPEAAAASLIEDEKILGGLTIKDRRMLDPQNPDHDLLYRDFLEVIVRLAQARYHEQCQSLHERLMMLLQNDILPKASKMPDDTFRAEMMEVQCLVEFQELLLKLFDVAVRKNKTKETGTGAKWQLTTVNHMIEVLSECKLLKVEVEDEDEDEYAVTSFTALKSAAAALMSKPSAEEIAASIQMIEDAKAAAVAAAKAEAAAKAAAEEAEAAAKSEGGKTPRSKPQTPRSTKEAAPEEEEEELDEEELAKRAAAEARTAVEKTANARVAANAIPDVVSLTHSEMTYAEFVEALCRIARHTAKGIVGREEAPLDIQLQFYLNELEVRAESLVVAEDSEQEELS
ncbi:radial spoke head protein 10B [Pseudoscourfieldia marina]